MQISFEKSHSCSCYENLVNNETDRIAIKKFTKFYPKEILNAVLKTHKKLLIAPNAHFYNLTVSGDNKIELKQGIADKDPLILKVRVQEAFRKFFYFIEMYDIQRQYCLKKNWTGQFNEVVNIHVFDVNKHKY